MVEKCYLCENKHNKNENIVLHWFPKKCPTLIHIHQQWLNMCGLNKQDDISNIYICNSYFKSSVCRIKNKRLRLHHGVIPTIDVLNQVVKKKTLKMMMRQWQIFSPKHWQIALLLMTEWKSSWRHQTAILILFRK